MPQLDLRRTENGPRYYLDEHPLRNGDLIEVETNLVVSDTGRLRGRFLWTGEVGDQPYVRSTQYGLIIPSNAVVHLVESERIARPAKRRPAKAKGKADRRRRAKR
jgi:hypothetical protein